MRFKTISSALLAAIVIGIWGPSDAHIVSGLPLRAYAHKPPFGRSHINWGDPITRGLVGVWDFNEQAGSTVFDQAFYGPGSFVNVPVWKNDSIEGSVVSFTAASSQSISITSRTVTGHPLGSGSGGPVLWPTFEVKFRMNSLRNFNGVISKSSGNQPCPFDSYVDSGGTFNFFYGTCGAVAPGHITSGSALSASTWYHVFLVGGDTVQAKLLLYINGAISASTAWNAGLALDDDGHLLRIGTRDDGATFMDGQISFVRIWNRSLYADEIARLTTNPYCFEAENDPTMRLVTSPAQLVKHKAISQ